MGAGGGVGADAGADDAGGSWFVIGWSGAVVLAALAISPGPAVAAGLWAPPAPVGVEAPGEFGVVGLDAPNGDGDDGELALLDDGADVLIGLVGVGATCHPSCPMCRVRLGCRDC